MNKITTIAFAAVAVGAITAAPAQASPAFCAHHEDGNVTHQPGGIYIAACPTTNTGNGGEWHYEFVNGVPVRVDGPASLDPDLTDGEGHYP